MTHDELLTRLDDYGFGVPPLNALRAVVELHRPLLVKDYENDNDWYECQECSGNGFSALYPCETIKAIEKELG